jgi:hypothetical protein
MNRRTFLQALFAVPVLAAPLLVPVSLAGQAPATCPECFIDCGGIHLSVAVCTDVDRDQGVVTFTSMTPRDARAFRAAHPHPVPKPWDPLYTYRPRWR